MNRQFDADEHMQSGVAGKEEPILSDAPSDIGDVSDVAEAERLDEERARRRVGHEPEIPDRAFDHITPQV